MLEKFDKAYLRRVGLYFLGTVIALAAAVYIGYHLYMSFTREIETVPAVPETYSITSEYDVWLVRDEVALSRTSGGTVVPFVANGEKVGKNDSVCGVYSSVTSEKITELRSVRDQIRLLEGKHSSSLGGDLGMGEVMLSLASSTKNGSLSSAGDISSRLSALAAARLSGGGNIDGVISELREKESGIISSLGTSSENVYSPVSGWYYSSSDGYESVLTPDLVVGASPSALEEILASSPEKASSSAGRIVRSYLWYAAVIMSDSDGSAFPEGKKTTLLLPGFTEPFEFVVESSVSGSDGRTAVVFSCSTIPEGADFDRHLTLSFTVDEITGYGIPKHAVRMVDDCTGVYVYNGVVVRFRRINIIGEVDDLYIAEVYDNMLGTTAPVTTAPPSTEEGTDGTGTADPETTDPPVTTEDPDALIDGVGTKDHFWLETHEFIVVKGQALNNGKVIG